MGKANKRPVVKDDAASAFGGSACASNMVAAPTADSSSPDIKKGKSMNPSPGFGGDTQPKKLSSEKLALDNPFDERRPPGTCARKSCTNVYNPKSEDGWGGWELTTEKRGKAMLEVFGASC